MADLRIKIEPYEQRRDRKLEWHLAVCLLRHFAGMTERAACRAVFEMVRAEHSLATDDAVRIAVRRIGPTDSASFVSRLRKQPAA